MLPALELLAVSRRFGGRRALAPLSLQLEPGSVCVVEGPNGAGKTTLLRLAAGLLAPTAGARVVRGRALYLRAGGGLRGVQRLDRALADLAALAGVAPDQIGVALDLLDLTALAARRVDELSAGQRVRASLAVACLARPALACLDEPGTSLDQSGRQAVREVVERLRREGTCLLVATHDPDLLARPDGRLRLVDGRVVLPAAQAVPA